MSEIPAGIDDVTVEWLNGVTGWSADSLAAEIIGVGIGVSSAVYRLTLSGDAPPSAIVKLTALDETAVFTSTVLRMYEREVRFFEHHAADAPVRMPAGFAMGLDEDGSAMFLVMEDLGDLRAVDQIAGMDPDDTAAAVDNLAVWHAHYWGRGDDLVATGAAVPISVELYEAILPGVFLEGWARVVDEMAPPAPIAAIADRWGPAMMRLTTALDRGPTSFCHGDYRADNILFDGAEPVVLDFQLGGRSSASYDFAYFLTQSIDAEVASARERDLFDRWVAALVAGGVPEGETADLWEQHRRAALFCVIYPLAAVRQMDLTDQRQYDLVDVMIGRAARVVDELNLADLL